MVSINDDQCDIADIVLGVWLKFKKSNHPSVQLPHLGVVLLLRNLVKPLDIGNHRRCTVPRSWQKILNPKSRANFEGILRALEYAAAGQGGCFVALKCFKSGFRVVYG